MTSTVPDGPDTELAAAWLTDAEAEQEAVEWFRRRDRYGTDPEDWIADGGDGQRHAATIVRAVLARPAAGRDLTAQDVHDALSPAIGGHRWEYWQTLADRLNAVARPAVAGTDGKLLADVRERVAEAIAQAIGHRKDYDTPDCSDADSTLGCQHPGGHPQEPGCEDCASWGWPCSVALTAADAAIEAAENPDPAPWPRDTHPVRQEYEDVVQRVAQELFALHGGPGSVWADLTCELAEGWREQARTVLRGARVPVLVSVEESDDVDW